MNENGATQETDLNLIQEAFTNELDRLAAINQRISILTERLGEIKGRDELRKESPKDPEPASGHIPQLRLKLNRLGYLINNMDEITQNLNRMI